jgi:hypothetical protein
MQEIGEDPMQLNKEIVKSNEEQVKDLEAELKFRQNDMRVSGLEPEEKKARIAIMNTVKDRLDIAKKELELAKQSEIGIVQMQQNQSQSAEMSQTQNVSQSQVQAQT